jgi:hypothetical protein
MVITTFEELTADTLTINYSDIFYMIVDFVHFYFHHMTHEDYFCLYTLARYSNDNTKYVQRLCGTEFC